MARSDKALKEADPAAAGGQARRRTVPRARTIALAAAAGAVAGVVIFRAPIAEAVLRLFFQSKGLSPQLQIKRLDPFAVVIDNFSLRQAGEEVAAVKTIAVKFDWANPIAPKIRVVSVDEPVARIALGPNGVNLHGLDKLAGPEKGERKPPPKLAIRGGRIELTTPAGAVALKLAVSGGEDAPLRIAGDAGRTALSSGDWSADVAQFHFLAVMTPDGDAQGDFTAAITAAFAPDFRLEKAAADGKFMLEKGRLTASGKLGLGRLERDGLRIDDLVLSLASLAADLGRPGDKAGAQGRLTVELASGAMHWRDTARAESLTGTLDARFRSAESMDVSGEWRGLFRGVGARSPALPRLDTTLGLELSGFGGSHEHDDVRLRLTAPAGGDRAAIEALLVPLGRGLPDPLAGQMRDLGLSLANALAGGASLATAFRVERNGAKGDARINLTSPTILAGAGLNIALAPADARQNRPFLVADLQPFKLAGAPALRVTGAGAPALDLALQSLAFDAKGADAEGSLHYRSGMLAPDQLLLDIGALRVKWSQGRPGKRKTGGGRVELERARLGYSGTLSGNQVKDLALGLDGVVALEGGDWRFSPRSAAQAAGRAACLPVAASRISTGQAVIGPFKASLCGGETGFIFGGADGTSGDLRAADLRAPFRLAGDATGSLATPALFDGEIQMPSLSLRFHSAPDGETRVAVLAPRILGHGRSVLDEATSLQAGATAINARAGADGDWHLTGETGAFALHGGKLAYDISNGGLKFDASPLADAKDKVRVALSDIKGLILDTARPRNFAPIAFSGRGLLNGDMFTARIGAKSDAVAIGEVDIDADAARGAGEAHYVSGPIRFTRDGLQPKTLAPIFAGQINEAEGEIAADFTVKWAPDRAPVAPGVITIRDVGFANVASGPVRGVNTQLHFADLFTLTSERRQSLTIESVNPGVPIEGLSIDYSIRPAMPGQGVAAPVLVLEHARIPTAGGALTLANAEIPLAPAAIPGEVANATLAPVLRLPLKIEGVDIQKVLDLLQIKDWRATGLVEGVFPIEIEGTHTRVVKGYARASGGEIHGDASTLDLLSNHAPGSAGFQGPKAAGLFGPRLPDGREIAFQGLKDFAYDTIEIKVNGDLTGVLAVVIDLTGRSQSVLNGAPLHYSIGANFDAADIQRGFSAAEQISRGSTAKDLLRKEIEQEAKQKNAKKR